MVVAKTKLALFQPKRAFKLMASPPTPPEAILFLTKSELQPTAAIKEPIVTKSMSIILLLSSLFKFPSSNDYFGCI